MKNYRQPATDVLRLVGGEKNVAHHSGWRWSKIRWLDQPTVSQGFPEVLHRFVIEKFGEKRDCTGH